MPLDSVASVRGTREGTQVLTVEATIPTDSGELEESLSLPLTQRDGRLTQEASRICDRELKLIRQESTPGP
jgi:hypothetical protein